MIKKKRQAQILEILLKEEAITGRAAQRLDSNNKERPHRTRTSQQALSQSR